MGRNDRCPFRHKWGRAYCHHQCRQIGYACRIRHPYFHSDKGNITICLYHWGSIRYRPKSENICVGSHISRFGSRWQSGDYREITGENSSFHGKRTTDYLYQPLSVGNIQPWQTQPGKHRNFGQSLPLCPFAGAAESKHPHRCFESRLYPPQPERSGRSGTGTCQWDGYQSIYRSSFRYFPTGEKADVGIHLSLAMR